METKHAPSKKSDESKILPWPFPAMQANTIQTDPEGDWVGVARAAGGASHSCAGALQQPSRGEELIQFSLLTNFFCNSGQWEALYSYQKETLI